MNVPPSTFLRGIQSYALPAFLPLHRPSNSRASTYAVPVARYADSRFTLDDGAELELHHAVPEQDTKFAPLLLVHGSYHGAWCWQEQFMPYLASKGLETFAVSLRGQGTSTKPKDMKASSLAGHSSDLAELLEAMPVSPILVGHSFGGLLVQRYLLGDKQKHGNTPAVAGMALLCSATPQGNQGLVGRLFKQDPWGALRLTWSFLSKDFLHSAPICRRMFFSDDLPEEEVEKYRHLLDLHASPIPVVNIWAMRKEVPLPDARPGLPPVMVMGGDCDLILDEQAVRQTAEHYGVDACILPNMAHDCMLDTRWQSAADHLAQWVMSLQPS